MAINLKEFLEGFKTSEVQLWEKKWIFREPKIKDIQKPIMKILEEYCIEWDRKEFKDIFENELPVSKQKEFLEKVLKEVGLA